ncbi:MAG: cation:proton antiporter [Thermoprotei archaeon]
MFPFEPIVLLFLAIMLLASLTSQKTHVPYTLVLVIAGIILTTSHISLPLGLLGKYLGSSVLEVRLAYTQLTAGGANSLFIGLVVPPLIFDAMAHVRSDDLRKVLRRSIFLATFGVALATVITGLILWRLAGLPIRVAFIFSAIISPTDTATVISVFKSSGLPSRLSTILETEAAFNDATAIIIFTVILASSNIKRIPFIATLGSFAITFGGGLLVGLLMSVFAAALNNLITDRLAKTILSLFAVYGSYIIASTFGLSGLVSVAVVGLLFGNTAAQAHFDPFTRETVSVFWEIAAFAGNSVAFLFFGFDTNFFALVHSFGYIVVAFGAIMAARAAAVYPAFFVFDRIEDFKTPASWKNTVLLGGMRGALSVALASSLYTSSELTSTVASEVATLVLGVAFLSLTLQAAALALYTKARFYSPMHRREAEDQ